jgi:hypothetical protein
VINYFRKNKTSYSLVLVDRAVKQLVKRKERKDVAFEKHTSIVTCFKGFWGVIGTKSHCVLLGRLSNRGRRPQ